jgi:hypothetical protein
MEVWGKKIKSELSLANQYGDRLLAGWLGFDYNTWAGAAQSG